MQNAELVLDAKKKAAFEGAHPRRLQDPSSAGRQVGSYMNTVSRTEDSGEIGNPRRLPIRWAVIATWTGAAALGAFLVGGPLAAIPAGCAVAVAAHRLID